MMKDPFPSIFFLTLPLSQQGADQGNQEEPEEIQRQVQPEGRSEVWGLLCLCTNQTY